MLRHGVRASGNGCIALHANTGHKALCPVYGITLDSLASRGDRGDLLDTLLSFMD